MLTNNINAITASSYTVMNMDNNQVLLSNNQDNQRLIASITKIMTCIIAIENGNLNDTITADEDILKGIGSSIYIEIGESMTLNDLLYGLMLRSGNDAAIMISKHISGSMENFTSLMNDYASKIGMKNTIFYNSHGLEDTQGIGNLSTSYDMALLTSYAFKNATFRKIFSSKKYTGHSDKKTYHWVNKNKLLKYDYITGGKTGYTIKAKRTLVTTGYINDMNIVIVTLNDLNDWLDHLELYNSIKNNYVMKKILDKNKINYINSLKSEKLLYLKNDFSYCINKNYTNNIEIIYNINEIKDNVIGVVEVYNNNILIYTDKIYYKENNKKIVNKVKDLFKKIFK